MYKKCQRFVTVHAFLLIICKVLVEAMSLLVQINKSVSTRLNAAMGSLTVVMDQTNNAVSTVVDR